MVDAGANGGKGVKTDRSFLTSVSDSTARLSMSVLDKMKTDFGGLQFGTREPTRREKEESHQNYLNLTIQDMDTLVQTYGQEAVGAYISHQEKHRRG